ncbi:hypothetical protein [Ponticaulis sp.]|uniref:hypothetical protein n=1 Tax=Ponticaulis sp. TaxID=2020902 RepID=UPI000B6E7F7D|nr:hypothetical protein [Ponticaulis sp.]MAI90261.1 DUF2065 domain-containing protein [Ponticaulis sp.]OUX99904.1 MAG: hypothetical protein CBB65_07455 [Hyphomonadaceae bacterium TMED5]|tara:strand:+ start:240419 stop:240826 length:408 start_codon:yes stop_codon:yes gene_type:complete
MITTGSVLTLFLAKAFGGYMLAAGLSGLTMRKRWVKIIDEMKASAAISYLAGIVVFAIGCCVVGFHSFWTDPLAVLITLIGWGAILEGVLFLVMPGLILQYSASLLRPAAVPFIAGLAGGAGLALFIVGLFGRVS